MIEIINIKKESPTYDPDFLVDRTTVLGNPFQMRDESQRYMVCDMYEDYFRARLEEERDEFHTAVDNLVDFYKKHGRLRLFCWCVPKRCHAFTIAKYIEEVVHNVKSR